MALAPILARDKLLHFITGSMLCAAVVPLSVPGAASAVLCAAIGKELYDAQHKEKHTPEVLDALCTIAGGVYTLAVCWLYTL